MQLNRYKFDYLNLLNLNQLKNICRENKYCIDNKNKEQIIDVIMQKSIYKDKQSYCIP